MHKKLLALALSLYAFQSLSAQESAMDAVYQLAPWKAVHAGLYQGFATCGEILRRGDLGFVILESLEGEGIILDGKTYGFAAGGEVVPVAATNPVCFAVVKVFDANQSGIRAEEMDLSDLMKLFDTMLQTRNLPVAVKLEGDFATVKIASVPKQSMPYPPWPQAMEQQQVQSLTNVTGTVTGFRFPEYLGETSPAGYRFYFIRRDRKVGGRVLNLRVRNIRFDFDYSHRLHIEFPAWGEFYSMP